MTPSELVLGISISGNGAQAVEVERQGDTNTLRAIDEWGTTFPNDDEFPKHLSAFLRIHRVKARQAAVAIDTTHLVIQRIPMENPLPDGDVKSRIHWELQQMHPEEPPNEFITYVFTLAEHGEEGWNDVLSVSVRRRHARMLSHMLERMGTEVRVLDADHFSAQTAMQVNYPETALEYVALTAVKAGRLDISMIRNGELLSYEYAPVTTRNDIVEKITAISQKHEELHSIMLHGPYLDEDLIGRIRDGATMRVEALNPLRQVKIAESIIPPDPPTLPPCRFAAAIGVALRRD